MKQIINTLLVTLLLCGVLHAAPYKVLIVDGQNNHNWAGTTPIIKSILEETGLFIVDVATTPAKGKPMDVFKPAFDKYDVVFSNYNGANWPQSTQTALEQYMKQGGGLVVYHAADNAFSKWGEWNKMIGLGGWGGRNEKSGPMIRYRDGKIVRDMTPGAGGTHGPQHAFQIVNRQPEHPIMQGLPEKWMHVKDELYSKLRGPAENMTLLATAYADPAQRGTGENEPMLLTIQYGKGRVFHTVLGHGPEQLKCVCCITLLQRGTEWAASGKVTQAVPADFPGADEVSIRVRLTADYDAIERYDFGRSRKALALIEEEIRSAPRNKYPEIEGHLLQALKASGTSLAGKQFCCRMLRRIGSAASVPTLAAMLSDGELSHYARFALQRMPAEAAGVALRRALQQVKGDLRIGIIGSLGLRGDRTAVSDVRPFLNSRDPQVVEAAVKALGRIGGLESAKALQATRVTAALQSARDDALLKCADSLVETGKKDVALTIYQNMVSEEHSVWTRIAAYRGQVLLEPNQAGPVILTLLKDRNVNLQRAAGKLIVQIPGTDLTRGLAGQLENLEPSAQLVLLSALETREDKVAATAVKKMAETGTNEVQVAALKALGTLGGADDIAFLAMRASTRSASARSARQSLVRLTGPDIATALVKYAQGAAPAAARIVTLEVLVERHDQAIAASLCRIAKDKDPQVRKAAYNALGDLAGADELTPIVALLVENQSQSERTGLERALKSILGRTGPDPAIPILKSFKRADSAVQLNLLGLLPSIGTDDALQIARYKLTSDDADIQKQTLRILSKWPNDAPLSDLMRVAQEERSTPLGILALRGYIDLLATPMNRSAVRSVQKLQEALAVAQRVEEKKAILSVLTHYPCQEALALAKPFETDAILGKEAQAALKKLTEQLANRSMTATASLNPNDVKNALDGNVETRWSTGRGMKPGDWFVLDLGVETTVKGIRLDTTRSKNDYPRGYELYVSFDGGKWGDPIVTGKGNEGITEILFPKPVQTRYLKIVQTGSAPSWYWSIHKLDVVF